MTMRSKTRGPYIDPKDLRPLTPQPTPHGQDGEELREKLKLAIIVGLTVFKATSCNAYMHFHGQEEGEDPTMDKYWKQEAVAEEALYKAIEAGIAIRLRDMLDSLESEGPEYIDPGVYTVQSTTGARGKDKLMVTGFNNSSAQWRSLIAKKRSEL